MDMQIPDIFARYLKAFYGPGVSMPLAGESLGPHSIMVDQPSTLKLEHYVGENQTKLLNTRHYTELLYQSLMKTHTPSSCCHRTLTKSLNT